MNDNIVQDILRNELGFSDNSIRNMAKFHEYLIQYNKNYNLISKSTEKSVWVRHILDSAQLIKFLDPLKQKNIADFGSGAGFPGLIIAFYNENRGFHVKLYEKSKVKRQFLLKIKEKLDLKNVDIASDIYHEEIKEDIIICRAFKKLEEIIRISREKIKKPHKLLILKGKNAQTEINKVSLGNNYSYKLESSITEHDSKIIIVNAK